MESGTSQINTQKQNKWKMNNKNKNVKQKNEKEKKHRTPSPDTPKRTPPPYAQKDPDSNGGTYAKATGERRQCRRDRRKNQHRGLVLMYMHQIVSTHPPIPSTLFLSTGSWVAGVMLRCVGVIGSAGSAGGGIDGGTIQIWCLLSHLVVHCRHLTIQTPDLA